MVNQFICNFGRNKILSTLSEILLHAKYSVQLISVINLSHSCNIVFIKTARKQVYFSIAVKSYVQIFFLQYYCDTCGVPGLTDQEGKILFCSKLLLSHSLSWAKLGRNYKNVQKCPHTKEHYCWLSILLFQQGRNRQKRSKDGRCVKLQLPCSSLAFKQREEVSC